MLQKCLWAFLLFVAPATLQAQEKYFTKTGRIDFFSAARLEDIEARNKTVAAVLDTKSGALQFAVLMKGFEFKKALMQEHFNENYVESDRFPKAEFRGQITNNSDIQYTTDGIYTATVRGRLTLHGVTKDLEATGTIRVSGRTLQINSVFTLRLSDYNISIPAIVRDNVAPTVCITVQCPMEPFN